MAQKIEKRRARRQRLTRTIAMQRRADHLARIHAGAQNVDCACELANTYFAKRAALACGCRKRTKGRPRVACGMCDVGDRDRIYAWRQELRELQAVIRAGRDVEERDRSWPRGKTGPKEYVVEKRELDCKGHPGDWYEYRRYRTQSSRDNALAQLRKSTSRAEFRAMGPCTP